MITVENVSKRYGTVEALKGITLALAPNEILGIVGPSGCGKTTLLRILAGFEQPDEGKVTIDGIEASTTKSILAPHKRRLSMIFQDLALWPHMTVEEHIEFVLKKEKLARAALKSKTREVLQNVNLNGLDRRYPRELSGGEKQRLAIARALASHAKYLLMDEPLSSLDSILKEDLEELLLRLQKRFGMGMIYVTHHMEDAFRLSHRLGVMNQGRLEQIGTKEEVIHNPKNEFVRRLLKLR